MKNHLNQSEYRIGRDIKKTRESVSFFSRRNEKNIVGSFKIEINSVNYFDFRKRHVLNWLVWVQLIIRGRTNHFFYFGFSLQMVAKIKERAKNPETESITAVISNDCKKWRDTKPEFWNIIVNCVVSKRKSVRL